MGVPKPGVTDRRGPSTGYLMAFDKVTGEQVWLQELPSTPGGAPMTYVHGGRQFIVVPVGNRGEPHELVAYALPTSEGDQSTRAGATDRLTRHGRWSTETKSHSRPPPHSHRRCPECPGRVKCRVSVVTLLPEPRVPLAELLSWVPCAPCARGRCCCPPGTGTGGRKLLVSGPL